MFSMCAVKVNIGVVGYHHITSFLDHLLNDLNCLHKNHLEQCRRKKK